MYSSQKEYLGLFSSSSLVTNEQYSRTVRLKTQHRVNTPADTVSGQVSTRWRQPCVCGCDVRSAHLNCSFLLSIGPFSPFMWSGEIQKQQRSESKRASTRRSYDVSVRKATARSPLWQCDRKYARACRFSRSKRSKEMVGYSFIRPANELIFEPEPMKGAVWN